MEGEPSNKRARQEEPHRGPATGQATASSAESSGQTTAARPRFRVSAQDHHNRRFPHYSQPREVGCMSRDADHRWHNDSDHELRYFKEPVIGCDLSAGFATFIKKDEEKEKQEHITPILSWLHAKRASGSRTAEMDVIAHPEFVAWRGAFAKLLCAPYNRSETWRLLACRFKGTIYIAEKDTPETLARRRNQTEREELMGYWGYKFEDYATRPRAGAQEPNDGPVSNIPCYCTVVRARLGSHLLLMSGETDCCMEGQAKPPDNYVELKTNKVIATERDRTSFERYKLLKFWSQSFLAGVPRVVVGFRDDEGIVRTVQHLNTLDMPRFVEGKRGMWDSGVCMNFCDQFLTWVARLFEGDEASGGEKDETKVVWALDFGAPFNHVEAARSDDGSLAFLPAWFTSTVPSATATATATADTSAANTAAELSPSLAPPQPTQEHDEEASAAQV